MNEFPTLRVGEPVPEGWLEYLHDLLGQPMGTWHDQYDARLAQIVKDFQQEHHLQVDGVVGDQTWAALRGEALPRAPGANPGFAEHTRDMRFAGDVTYVDGDDVLYVSAIAVGTLNPGDGEVTLEVEVQRPDGVSNHVTATNVGVSQNYHAFYVQGTVGGAGPGGVYKALMWLPQEWGQDNQTYEWNHVPQ